MNSSDAGVQQTGSTISADAFDASRVALGRLFSSVGVNLGHYHRAPLLRRLTRRMRQLDLDCIEDYVLALSRDSAELRQLGYELQRPQGFLLQDAAAVAALHRLLTTMITATSPPQLWLPGCGHGRDVHALAMLATQALGNADFTVYGTDAEFEALGFARTGAFEPAAVDLVPPALRAQFLVEVAPDFSLAPALLRRLLFLAHDLCTPSPLFNLDLVCCRNLLGNLDLTTQRRVLEFMHSALRPGGWLLANAAEGLPGQSDLFVAHSLAPGLYRRVEGAKRLSAQRQTPAFFGEREIGIYRAAFRASVLPGLILDENFDICDSNAAAAALAPTDQRASHRALLARNLPELFAETDCERIRDSLRGLASLGETMLSVTLTDGRTVGLGLSRLGDSGAQRFLAECVLNVGGEKLDTHLAVRAGRAEASLQVLSEGLIILDTQGSIVEFNPAAERLTGWRRAEALGQPHGRVFRLGRPVGGADGDGPVELALAGNAPLRDRNDLHLQHRNGRRFALKLRVKNVPMGGAVLVFEDVSELNLMTEQMAYRASHDALTGLLNREEFEARCRAALTEARSKGGTSVLCYIDIDQFKVINDTLGHVAGDELLHDLAVELRSQVRENDVLARLGGDEFGVLLADMDLAAARVVVESLIEAARTFRFSWSGQAHSVTISIGVALMDASTRNVTRALSMADAACFVAKDAGRDRARYAGDDDELSRRYVEMSLVGKIGKALDEGRFVLHYEDVAPIDDLGQVIYRELLVRMLDDDGGLVAPAAFIQAAERYFLMNAVDRWVLREALQSIARLPPDKIIYAVNLSGQSLGDEKFLDYVLAELDSSGVDPERLCFEITETAAVSRLSEAVRFIDRLSGSGCRFALDDFGSGMASFSYLKNFRVDFLKIDGSFVRAMLGSRADRGMVESINRIGHEMGLKTIAEHVENAALLKTLREMNVDWVQGRAIAWSKPFSALSPPVLIPEA